MCSKMPCILAMVATFSSHFENEKQDGSSRVLHRRGMPQGKDPFTFLLSKAGRIRSLEVQYDQSPSSVRAGSGLDNPQSMGSGKSVADHGITGTSFPDDGQ